MSGKIKLKINHFFKKHVLGSYDSNIKLSISAAVGVLIGIIPIWGFQTITAAFLAVSLRLNKVILLTASHVSVPPLTPIIVFISYIAGGLFFNTPESEQVHFRADFDYKLTEDVMYQYISGSIVLAFVSAILTGCIVYLLLYYFRKEPENINKGNEYVRI